MELVGLMGGMRFCVAGVAELLLVGWNGSVVVALILLCSFLYSCAGLQNNTKV